MSSWLQKQRYNLTLLLIGALFVFTAIRYLEPQSDSARRRFSVQILLNEGPATLHRSTFTRQNLTTSNSWLFDQDSVETGPGADLSLRVDGQTLLRVHENSLITLNMEGERTLFTIKRGQLNVESHGPGSTTWISKNGLRYSVGDYLKHLQNPDQKLGIKQGLPPQAPRPTATELEPNQEYSMDYIQNTLSAYQKNFYRCYSLAIQKQKSRTGKATLQFDIASTGTVLDPKVTHNSLSIEGFESCLVEALSRIPFRSHTGESVHAILPLTFE